MSTDRFDRNDAGIKEVALTGAAIRAVCHAKAAAVADSARAANVPIVVRDAGISRARSYVILDSPVGALLESRDRILGTALDAARG